MFPCSSGKWFWYLGGLALNNNTDKAMDIIESMAAVRNMRSYASYDGKTAFFLEY